MPIIPIRDLKDTVAIEKLCAMGEPVFITKNGYGRLVVMDIDTYNKKFKETNEAKLVNEALKEIDSGTPLLDGENVKAEMIAKYAK
ncbi:MAG: type II toxin-antitoxin system Phd/YefM family antitoxin [Firmicutes bacterium]|nr:type II toxin-antitoxin system Phd/YefM family antitoxin [Bacillota bacterium]